MFVSDGVGQALPEAGASALCLLVESELFNGLIRFEQGIDRIRHGIIAFLR